MRRLLAAAVLALALLPLQQPGAQTSRDAPYAQDPRTQPCFGAASRDPVLPCRNPALDDMVYPDPDEAFFKSRIKCDGKEYDRSLIVCSFGVPLETATESVAIVGDSHAAHWRPAILHAARARGWHLYSLTHASCPLQLATRKLREPKRTSCIVFKRAVMEWFQRHPEITTIFVSGLTGGSGVVTEPGQDEFEARVESFLKAWDALPDNIARIIVIRDTPKFHFHVVDCIEEAQAEGRKPGSRCSITRKRAFDPDAAVEAARRIEFPHASVIDLSHAFCGLRTCYPVVGGALVHRDANHMTGTFSETLGPQFQRAVDALLGPPG